MNPIRSTTRRGLTLMEVMFAITITVLVGAAMTGVIGAVAAGVETRRDSQSHLVRAHAAQSRLGAYIVPSRAILHADNTVLVLWFDDSRQSETVHGSEIRWLHYDGTERTVKAYYVKLPDSWTETEKLLADREHARTSNWMTVLRDYETAGLISSVVLVDNITDLAIDIDAMNPLASRHVAMRLTIDGVGGPITSLIAGTLRTHRPPVW